MTLRATRCPDTESTVSTQCHCECQAAGQLDVGGSNFFHGICEVTHSKKVTQQGRNDKLWTLSDELELS